MRYLRPLQRLWRASLLTVLASPLLCAQTPNAQTHGSTVPLSTRPVAAEQIREYLGLTQFGEIWRVGWLRAMDANKAKGAPYWPESFWSDLKKHMETVDLVPMVTQLYRNHVSYEDMRHANVDLHKMSVSEFADTPFGSHFCQETRLSGPENEAATLALTQTIFQQVYEEHKTEIGASRTKYLAEHPGFVDGPSI